MQRRLLRRAIVRATQGLASAGHDLCGGRTDHVLHPAEQAALKRDRIELREDAPEGSVTGNAVGQGENGAQPGCLGVAEALHLDPGIGAADHRTQGDGKEIQQRVAFRARDARVGERGKMGGKAARGDRVHRLLSSGMVSPAWPSATGYPSPDDHRYPLP